MGYAIKILILVFIFTASQAYGACGVVDDTTWLAASHSDEDVQACIDGASDGDTINVPEGDSAETWNTQVDVNKAISLIGPGKDDLIISCDVADQIQGNRADVCIMLMFQAGLWLG